MTVSRTLNQIFLTGTINLQETITNTADPSAKKTVMTNIGGQFKFDTAPILATKAYHQLVSLSTGALTLDLTALVDSDLTQDMSGLALLLMIAVADSANANPFTIKPGASNGYTGWVNSNGVLLTTANDMNIIGPLYGGIDVDGTHKTIDLAGTGSQKVNLLMLFG